MQTRCVSCGKLMESLAQLCDDCQAREDERTGKTQAARPPASGLPPVVPAASTRPSSSHFLDYAILGAIGACIIAAVVWLLVLGGADTVGLGGDDSADQVAGAPTLGPVATGAPLGYEAGDCTFEAPEAAVVECGYLTVPQSRADPGGATVTLPVAVFKSASAGGKADPVIYLDGGPGSSTLDSAPILYEVMKPLVADRDLVLFDQRGAGDSEPSLDCPEVTELNYDLLEQQHTVAERVGQDASSARRCYERLLTDGIDPSFATSAENAADVEDLRKALGYDHWNLFGVSYGTRLALTVLRDFPGGVRSAILDSTYPPQADLYEEFGLDYVRALNQLFNSCSVDPACNQAYPDLRQAFDDVVRGLNERPATVALGSVTGRPVEGAVIDGVWFSAFVFQSLYSEQIIPLLPAAIFETRDGNYDFLTILADFYLQNQEGISPGMYLSVQCGEEAAFTDRDAAVAAARADPLVQDYNEYAVEAIFASCDEWKAPAADGNEDQPVNSDVPALVLAGEFDPITPPAWGRTAADGLANGYYFLFPGLAHGVTLAGDCPSAMAVAFLDNPAQEPPAGCIAGMGGLPWVVE